jgi:hypothetical protein
VRLRQQNRLYRILQTKFHVHLELAERLICPSTHQRTPLVVVALQTRERDLLEARLGCMLCRREGFIVNGHVMLRERVEGEANAALVGESQAALDRLEAQLGLAEPGARVLLAGRYALYADVLAARVDARVAALNVITSASAGVGSVFLQEESVPFSDGTFSAAAFDPLITTNQLHDALRTLQRGARIVGMHPLPAPFGVREIARDAVEWVGERDALPTDVVPLRRA